MPVQRHFVAIPPLCPTIWTPNALDAWRCLYAAPREPSWLQCSDLEEGELLLADLPNKMV